MLHDARAAALRVELSLKLTPQHWSPDPDDEDAFIRAALVAQAPWPVSGDENLLTVPAIEGLRILAPAQALLA